MAHQEWEGKSEGEELHRRNVRRLSGQSAFGWDARALGVREACKSPYNHRDLS